MIEYVNTGDTVKIRVFLWNGSAALAGKTVNVSIERLSDGAFYDGDYDPGTYAALGMSELTGNAHKEGVYEYSFATQSTEDVYDWVVKYEEGDFLTYFRGRIIAKQSPSAALVAYDPPTNAEMEARTLNATAAAALEDAFDGTGGATMKSNITGTVSGNSTHNAADAATAVWGAVSRTITGEVTTDSASREASKADVSDLATTAALAAVGGLVYVVLADTNELQTDDVPGLIAALRGADSDTLGTLSEQIDGASTFNAASDTVDVGKISGSTTAADNLKLATLTVVSGAATATTLSTTQMSTDLTEATDEHYNGRLLIWTSGNLQGQAAEIIDYDGATKTLTYTLRTEAPAEGDTFIIV